MFLTGSELSLFTTGFLSGKRLEELMATPDRLLAWLPEVPARINAFLAQAVSLVRALWWQAELRVPAIRGRGLGLMRTYHLFGLHRPGGLAQRVAVRQRLLHELPPGLPAHHAALTEPTTVAVHAVLLQPPRAGDLVLVTGPGPIGLLAGRLARAFGPHVVVAGALADAERRWPAARELGAGNAGSRATDQESLHSPPDLAFECSGGAPLEAAHPPLTSAVNCRAYLDVRIESAASTSQA